MRVRRRWESILFLLGLSVLSAAAPAQLPAGTQYVVGTRGNLYKDGLLAFSAQGAITTFLPTPSPVSPMSVAMAPTNDALLAFGWGSVARYDLASGGMTLSSANGWGGVTHAVVDEDGGMFRTIQNGPLLKADDWTGLAERTLNIITTSYTNAATWNGSTGGYVVAGSVRLSRDYEICFTDRQGVILRSLLVPGTSITGLDWCPFTGDLWVMLPSLPALLRVDPTGRASTIAVPWSGIVAAVTDVELREQPSPLLLCTEHNGQLTWISLLGQVTSLNSSFNYQPTGVAILRSRPLWATGTWKVGGVGPLSVDFGPALAGKYYQVALAFQHAPGIYIENAGTAHVTFDNLLISSFQVGPPVFNYFAGILDSRGRATPAPFVRLPALNELRGRRIYGAAIAYDKTGVQVVSNAWGTTLQ